METRPSLVSLLSHDLRSPLGPLTLAVSNLAEGEHPVEETQGLARIALAQTERLRRLIDAALLSSGRRPSVKAEPVAFGGVLYEAALVFEGSGGSVAVGAVPPVDVVADPALLRDALAGLMEVAAGAEMLPVECRLSATPGHAVLMIVSQVVARSAAALGADSAFDAQAAFAIAGRIAVELMGGTLELIDEGLVVCLPSVAGVHVA